MYCRCQSLDVHQKGHEANPDSSSSCDGKNRRDRSYQTSPDSLTWSFPSVSVGSLQFRLSFPKFKSQCKMRRCIRITEQRTIRHTRRGSRNLESASVIRIDGRSVYWGTTHGTWNSGQEHSSKAKSKAG